MYEALVTMGKTHEESITSWTNIEAVRRVSDDSSLFRRYFCYPAFRDDAMLFALIVGSPCRMGESMTSREIGTMHYLASIRFSRLQSSIEDSSFDQY